jgi:hypothetical protein
VKLLVESVRGTGLSEAQRVRIIQLVMDAYRRVIKQRLRAATSVPLKPV